MKTYKQLLSELTSIQPLDPNVVDKEIARHNKKGLAGAFVNRGVVESEFDIVMKNGSRRRIQMYHNKADKKFIFVDKERDRVHKDGAVALFRYEKNKSDVIDVLHFSRSSDFEPKEGISVPAVKAIRQRHKIALDTSKMSATPQGRQTIERLKQLNLLEANLLNAPTKTIEQIANKHKVSIDQISRQLVKGMEVEKEHTKHSHVAREIALDHLWERPDYYTMLTKAEKK